MNNKINELKTATLDLIKVELSDFGIDPEKVMFNDRIEIEDHVIDIQKFVEKTNWSKPNYVMRAYTVDYGFVIFMPAKDFYEEFRSDDNLQEEMDLLRKQADSIISNFISCYFDEVRELNESKTLKERISNKVVNNYQITDSLSDAINWKVKIILGNSRGDKDPKVGEYGAVGYIHIGLNYGTVVPVAREDEHHRGYDLISHLIESGQIPQDTYYPFFCLGQDYVDSNDQTALQAMKIWRKLNGPNLILKNWNSRNVPFQLTMDDFIAKNGNIEINKGELFPLGQKLIDNLKEVSELCIESRKNPIKEKQLFVKATKAYMFFVKNIEVYMSDKNVQEMLSKIDSAKLKGGEEGIKELEQLFFGFDSFKNKLHNEVREALKPDYRGYSKDVVAIFGDVELANYLLGSL